MSATEILRRMLDERGVEWCEAIHSYHYVLTWWESPTFGRVHAVDNDDGTLFMACLNNCDFTPEQAVEATLGRGACRNVHEPPKTATFWPSPHFKCSECGEVHVSMQYVYYCPNCGRKVVDE